MYVEIYGYMDIYIYIVQEIYIELDEARNNAYSCIFVLRLHVFVYNVIRLFAR